MKTNDYETCQSMSDSELLEFILSGDMNVVFYLLHIKYQKKLYGVIHNCFKTFNINLTNHDDLEYWLYKFQNYINSPTKIVGKNQFENIENKENIENWLCQCCNFFILHYGNIESSIYDLNLETYATDDFDTDFETDSETEEFNKNTLKLKMADYFFHFSNYRDIYIIYSYLYCEYYEEKGGYIFRPDKKISDTLKNHGFQNMTANHVRIIKNRSYAKAEKFFKKTFNQSVEENRNLSYEDILIQRRKTVMSKLGIKRDFFTDIILKKSDD